MGKKGKREGEERKRWGSVAGGAFGADRAYIIKAERRSLPIKYSNFPMKHPKFSVALTPSTHPFGSSTFPMKSIWPLSSCSITNMKGWSALNSTGVSEGSAE